MNQMTTTEEKRNFGHIYGVHPEPNLNAKPPLTYQEFSFRGQLQRQPEAILRENTGPIPKRSHQLSQKALFFVIVTSKPLTKH